MDFVPWFFGFDAFSRAGARANQNPYLLLGEFAW